MNTHAFMDKWSVYGVKFIIQNKGNGRCFMLWVDCTSEEIVLWFVCFSEELVGSSALVRNCALVQNIICNMESSSTSFESTGSSPLAQFIETDIKEMKKKIKRINKLLGKLDSEGGRRLDNVDKDMVYLKKEIDHSISRTGNVLTAMLADLEIKFKKL